MFLKSVTLHFTYSISHPLVFQAAVLHLYFFQQRNEGFATYVCNTQFTGNILKSGQAEQKELGVKKRWLIDA